jgi:hypothetical protein
MRCHLDESCLCFFSGWWALPLYFGVDPVDVEFPSLSLSYSVGCLYSRMVTSANVIMWSIMALENVSPCGIVGSSLCHSIAWWAPVNWTNKVPYLRLTDVTSSEPILCWLQGERVCSCICQLQSPAVHHSVNCNVLCIAQSRCSTIWACVPLRALCIGHSKIWRSNSWFLILCRQATHIKDWGTCQLWLLVHQSVSTRNEQFHLCHS